VFGVGVGEMIIIVIILAFFVAVAVGVFSAVYLLAGKKKEAPSDPAQEKERRKKRLLWGCAGCAVGGLVVLALISVIASIAIPNYLRFQTLSRQSEARAILIGIYQAETAFYQLNNRYSTDPKEIGFDPASLSQYYFYQWEITYADNERFEAKAWGNIDEDPTIDTWVVTEASREPVNTIDDMSQ
jgi:Tfp pilus assembly protein PilE